jgi:S-DNA-T family DNA segregation ATPase FtsK/SpoIIIE
MLFVPPGSSNMERIQGAMVSDEDIEKIVEFSSAQAEQMFNDSVTNEENESDSESGAFDDGDIGDIDEGIDGSILENPMIAKYLKPDDGELIIKSMEILFRERKISTSYIQRRLKIGYNRAAEIVDLFEERGIIGPVPPGGGKRDILVFDELEEN